MPGRSFPVKKQTTYFHTAADASVKVRRIFCLMTHKYFHYPFCLMDSGEQTPSAKLSGFIKD